MTYKYEVGKTKRQYREERWKRYEELRAHGFLKDEARSLSALVNPDDLAIVERMIKQRDTLANKAIKSGASRSEFYSIIRTWYEKNRLTSVISSITSSETGKRRYVREKHRGGQPDVWVWYNRMENSIARSRGWIKGRVDDEGKSIVPRRKKRKTGTRRSRNKGLVTLQKARNRARKSLIRAKQSQVQKPLDWLEREIRTSQEIISSTRDQSVRRAHQDRINLFKSRVQRARMAGKSHG